MTISLSRRRFVTGVASSTALGLLGNFGIAHSKPFVSSGFTPQPAFSGNSFKLDIGYLPVNFTGQNRQAIAVNGSIPSPVLRWKEGERVTLDVKNNLAADSSIHWHGIILPTNNRKFQPFIGFTVNQAFGKTKRLIEAECHSSSGDIEAIIGIHSWF